MILGIAVAVTVVAIGCGCLAGVIAFAKATDSFNKITEG